MRAAPARSPTAEQAAAIGARDTNVLLEAGAGTGKTGVLVDRYCEAVVEGVSPEQIVAFTFTEKAAAELRRRVRSGLEARAGGAADANLAAALRSSVRQLGAAPVTTIHGFCRRLLASHPIAAGLDPRFRVLDEAEAGRIAHASFDAALAEMVASTGEREEDLLAAYRVETVRAIVLAAHGELRSRGAEPQLPEGKPRDLDAALGEVEATAAAALAIPGASEGQAECFSAALALAAARAERMPTPGELAGLDPGGGSAVAERRQCLDSIGRALAVAAEPEGGILALRTLDRLLGLFAIHYEDAKRRRSGLDFEDLQLRAVELLRPGTALGDSYRDRFAHVMVDEFQDTNALQVSLVETLRGPATRLFVVGDEFQAIYGFRNADLGVFLGERRRFRDQPGAEVARLRGNFRSLPLIVAAANEIGDALLEGFPGLAVGRDPEGRGGIAELLVTEQGWDAFSEPLGRAPSDPVAADTVAEARMLALRLREIADAGTAASEMVVLLRSLHRAEAFEGALARVGLTPHVVGGSGYWSRQQAQDLIALLGAIANPLADQPLLGALASPACGLMPDTLLLLRRAAGGRSIWSALLATSGRDVEGLEDPGTIEAIPGDQRQLAERFVTTLEDLRANQARLPLESLVERAVADTGYDLAVLLADHGERRMANVRKMMRLARSFEATEGRDLRGFLDYAEISAGADSEPPAAVDAEEGEGVRIMSIHSAKGLEFGVVAVAELGRNLLAGGRSPSLIIGPADEAATRVGLRLPWPGQSPLNLFSYEELATEQTGKAEAEELRLVYVAATRARDHLLLSGVRATTDHADPRALSALRRLLGHLGSPEPSDGESLELAPAEPIPELGVTLPTDWRVPVRVSSPGEEEATRLARGFDPPDGSGPLPGRHSLFEGSVPPVPLSPLSYSTLQQHARCGYRFYVEHVLGLGAEGSTAAGEEPNGASGERALRIGNAVHDLLRQGALGRWAPPSDAAVAAALAGCGLDRDREARTRVRKLVEGWTGSSLRAEVSGGQARVRAEHPFLAELAGSTLSGRIDLLVERPETAPLVIDFKTNRLDGRSPAELAEDYAPQRDLYAVAAAEGAGAVAVEVAYVFLESPEDPVRTRFDEEALGRARAGLAESVAAIRGGGFPVTPEPTWQLCCDCPARRRLCPAPAPAP